MYVSGAAIILAHVVVTNTVFPADKPFAARCDELVAEGHKLLLEACNSEDVLKEFTIRDVSAAVTKLFELFGTIEANYAGLHNYAPLPTGVDLKGRFNA